MFTQEQLDIANCINADPDLFFSTEQDSFGRARVQEAKAYCATCPIKSACLNEALAENLEGIWGGYTFNERLRGKHKPKRVVVLTPEKRAQMVAIGKRANKRRTVAAGAASVGHLTTALTVLADTLTDETKEIINLRIAHPDLSFAEIGEMMSTPLSKHAVAGRLRRVISEVKEKTNE